MLLSIVIDVRQYIDKNGKKPFEKWFRSLSAEAAAKVTTVLEKMPREISRTSRPSVMESRNTGETAINGHRLRQGKVRRI
jgi:hypothetical protein